MFLNPSVQMALSLTNITGFTSSPSKLINDIRLKRFRQGVLITEKSTKFQKQKSNVNISVFTKTLKNMSEFIFCYMGKISNIWEAIM